MSSKTNRYMPHAWKLATIIPIIKSNENHTFPNLYRPIPLLLCLSKIREKIIAKKDCLGYRTTQSHLHPLISNIITKNSALDHCLYAELTNILNQIHQNSILSGITINFKKKTKSYTSIANISVTSTQPYYKLTNM